MLDFKTTRTTHVNLMKANLVVDETVTALLDIHSETESELWVFKRRFCCLGAHANKSLVVTTTFMLPGLPL